MSETGALHTSRMHKIRLVSGRGCYILKWDKLLGSELWGGRKEREKGWDDAKKRKASQTYHTSVTATITGVPRVQLV